MYIGNGGYNWSSAVSGANGVFLHFDAQSLSPGGAGNRVYGFPLRCLSE
ncbi:hypothetical protein [uncultured Rikenella sp.]|nr:hypothetical protein [uncultured Rikenella sp.]